MAAGMSTDADPVRLTDQLGERWAIVETSFKHHAACRHSPSGRRCIAGGDGYTRDGRELAARVDEPKGDPGNTLSRE